MKANRNGELLKSFEVSNVLSYKMSYFFGDFFKKR